MPTRKPLKLPSLPLRLLRLRPPAPPTTPLITVNQPRIGLPMRIRTLQMQHHMQAVPTPKLLRPPATPPTMGNPQLIWADQAATAATSNIVPVISSVTGQGGATCTTGTTFTANVAVSPSSSITYTVTGVPGYSASGNSITFTGLSSGAYTAVITATYTPTGKTCSYPFTFFKI